MALGGGVFVTQNKVLPGSYINFVSAAKASVTLADRGIAALPLSLDWGKEGEVITLTSEDFFENAKELLGYDYTHDKMKGLRDVFKNAQKVFVYKLNTGVKAANTYCTAKFGGIRGNDLKTVIQKNVNDQTKYDVKTLLGNTVIDVQTVAAASGLVDNDFVTFKTTATLEVTASTPLTGGTNGSNVTGEDWTKAFSALDAYSFNTLGIVSTDDDIKGLAISYTKRMRDEVGVKFQTVVYNKAADDKGIINVINKVGGIDSADAVYWVTGAEAGCQVNKSVTNKVYDGDFDITVSYDQSTLEDAINSGKFVFHKVGDEIRVLTDINSKVTVTEEEGSDFKSNQTIRVLDQIANDIAVIFNTKYLGQIPNDTSGRVSLWSDIVDHHQQLETIRAIENFDSGLVTVSQGKTKKDVVVSDAVTPTNAMERLYMQVVVS